MKVLGATLHASKIKHHVDAPSSHSLPVIRCDAMEIEAAEIYLSQSRSGLEQLNRISPLFERIWGDSLSTSEDENEDTVVSDQRSLDMGSFRIVRPSVYVIIQWS